MKYVVVLGSVMSGIGKGITASSIGVVLKSLGIRVTAIKIDPYLNPDSGTMSPFEHGECYVLDDGGETDLDLGNYERFLGITLTRDHNITTGKIYSQVIRDERDGKYLGKTVQVVPHITDAIQEWIERTSRVPVDGSGEVPEMCIIELGGTIGDIESECYAEALRQLGYRLGRENVFYVNVCYCPVIGVTNETKTKPAQNGIREIRRHGINPDLLMVRCERELDGGAVEKLSNICQISREQIIINKNVSNIYRIPIWFKDRGLINIIDSQMRCVDWVRHSQKQKELMDYWLSWETLADRMDGPLEEVDVGIVGKYTGMIDSYLSLSHAVRDAGLANGKRVKLCFIESSELEGLDDEEFKTKIGGYKYLLIPGGFGQRGIEGMIRVAKWARENEIPLLGICLGFQVMVIEFARNVLGLKWANSDEFDPYTPHPVVTIIDKDQPLMGGTMRLGSHQTKLAKQSRAWKAYGEDATEVNERHRHRYEVNPKYLTLFDTSDMWFSGVGDDGNRMEIVELNGQSGRKEFYMGTQFHGEYLTRPGKAHPVFKAWLE